MRFTTYEGSENSYTVDANNIYIKNELGAQIAASTSSRIHCKTRVLKVGRVVTCDIDGVKDASGTYLTYEHSNTGSIINTGDINDTETPFGSSFIGCASAYPAVNYGPTNSATNEYRSKSEVNQTILAERFIDDGHSVGGWKTATATGDDSPSGNGVEALQSRELTTNTLVSTAAGYPGYNADEVYDINTSILDASLKKGHTSAADACMVAISAALTKQGYGNEIVRNDTVLRSDIRTKIRNHLNQMFGYNAPSGASTGTHGLTDGGAIVVKLDADDINSGGDSNLVSQYLASTGRSSTGATAVAQHFNFDNCDFTFRINLTGGVIDADNANSPPSVGVINSVFGSTTDQTLVSDGTNPGGNLGEFTVSVLLSLKNLKTTDNGSALSSMKNTGSFAVSAVAAAGQVVPGISADNSPTNGNAIDIIDAADVSAI